MNILSSRRIKHRLLLLSIPISGTAILGGSKSFIRSLISLLLNHKIYAFLTALLSFLAAVLKIITFIRKRKKVVRKRFSISNWLNEELKNFNTASRKLRQKNDFLKTFFSPAEYQYLEHLFEIFILKKEIDICTACNTFRHLFDGVSRPRVPMNIIENSVKIISKKCNHENPTISRYIFDCLSVFYKFSLPSSCINIYVDCFKNLLNNEVPVHVRDNTISELCLFMSEIPVSRWKNINEYHAIMKTIFDDLTHRSNPDENLLERCISNIKYCQNYYGIIDDLLPLVTDATSKHLHSLLRIYCATVLNLADSRFLDPQMVNKVFNTVQQWLKSDVEIDFKENEIPRILNYLDSTREIRHSESREKIELDITVKPNNNTATPFKGKTIDVSKNGLKFFLPGRLKGDDYQERDAHPKGFLLWSHNLHLSDVLITIFEPNGRTASVKINGDLRRAKNSSSGFIEFGAKVEHPDLKKCLLTPALSC